MSAATIVANSARACVRLLYPPHCNWCGTACEDDDLLICRACQLLFVPAVRPPRCGRCASLLPNHLLNADDCANCQKWKRPQISRTLAIASYTNVARQAVLRIKKAHEEPLAWSLGKLLAGVLANRIAELAPDVVMAVPMHWTRRWHRGINGPDILASCVARRLSLPLAGRALRRRQRTEPLEELSLAARMHTLRHVFAVRWPKSIQGRRVLLIDDVMTTGATCNSAARTLRAAGAADVICAVFARTE